MWDEKRGDNTRRDRPQDRKGDQGNEYITDSSTTYLHRWGAENSYDLTVIQGDVGVETVCQFTVCKSCLDQLYVKYLESQSDTNSRTAQDNQAALEAGRMQRLELQSINYETQDTHEQMGQERSVANPIREQLSAAIEVSNCPDAADIKISQSGPANQIRGRLSAAIEVSNCLAVADIEISESGPGADAPKVEAKPKKKKHETEQEGGGGG